MICEVEIAYFKYACGVRFNISYFVLSIIQFCHFKVHSRSVLQCLNSNVEGVLAPFVAFRAVIQVNVLNIMSHN